MWRRIGRSAHVALLATPLVAFLATFSGCGYTTRGFYPPDIRTVAVPVFESDTFRRDVEFELTQKVIQTIESRTPLSVVSREHADTVLLGTITTYDKNAYGEDGFDNPRGGNMFLAVNVTWLDRNGLVINTEQPNFTIQAQQPFTINIGQSEVTARAKAVEQIANRIVSLMQSPW